MKHWRIVSVIIVFGVISTILAGILIFPAKVENVTGTKNVTTENYRIASNYGNVSWNIVVPLDGVFILEKDGIIKFIKIINKSVEPVEVRIVKILDRWECKIINGRSLRINYTIYECEPINVRLAFINVTTDKWKLSTLGIFFRKNKIYVVGDIFAKDCSPIVNRSCNCSESSATLIAKIRVDGITIVNDMHSDDKLNISLNSTISRLTYTPKIQTPRVTPPPGMRTPLTPDYYIGKFVEYFNERNVTALYDLFSDRIKRNHSIKELEMALKFAEEHNVTIMRWKIISGRFSPGNVTVEMKISENGKIVEKRVAIPVTYRHHLNGSTIYYEGYIDRWIVDVIPSWQ